MRSATWIDSTLVAVSDPPPSYRSHIRKNNNFQVSAPSSWHFYAKSATTHSGHPLPPVLSPPPPPPPKSWIVSGQREGRSVMGRREQEEKKKLSIKKEEKKSNPSPKATLHGALLWGLKMSSWGKAASGQGSAEVRKRERDGGENPPCTSTRPLRSGLHLWLLDIQSLPEQILRLHAFRWLAVPCASLCSTARHWLAFGVFDTSSGPRDWLQVESVTQDDKYLV